MGFEKKVVGLRVCQILSKPLFAICCDLLRLAKLCFVTTSLCLVMNFSISTNLSMSSSSFDVIYDKSSCDPFFFSCRMF